MRRRNARPTFIYWLIDIRPETIAAGWSNGQPFYCGKTVEEPRIRLNGHRAKAKLWPSRKTHQRIIECGDDIRIQVMETVPVASDWVAREKHWIELLRFSFPGATNVSAGGVGTPGQIPSSETRAKRAVSTRTSWADGSIAKRRCDGMRAAWTNETIAARRRESMRAGWAKRRERLKAAQHG
ncbi:GIY-YIG nuclease family protein [Bradyrhizobium pachyrhizi]|uniref:GIY-YIG nuclease family protein n=1 Tax=Bradyrhizobium pachyrhizi TaxID=280333 RepID=UPI0012E3CBA8|nr:GIY-YIG nuclease family protein [Bradyrhizobium pachyrhizi]